MQRPPPRYVSGPVASVARPTKRKLAIFLAVILVAVVALVAATSGLGQPGLPDGDVAYVDGVDNGNITQDDLDAGLAQAAAQGGLKEVPATDDPQYQSLHDQAMQSLILAVWVEGEASDRGITATQEDIDAELKQIKSQSFKSEAEFNKFVKQSKFTEEDVQEQVKLTLLRDKLEQAVVEHADGLRRRDQEVLRRQHRQLQAAGQPRRARHPQLLAGQGRPGQAGARGRRLRCELEEGREPVLPGPDLQGPRRPARGADRGSGRPPARGSGLLGSGGRDRRPVQDRSRLLRDRGDQDHPGDDPAARAGERDDQAAARRGPPAADRQRLPDRLLRQVDGADDLRARGRDRAVQQLRRARGRAGSRSADPAAGRLDQADRTGHVDDLVDGSAAQGLPQGPQPPPSDAAAGTQLPAGAVPLGPNGAPAPGATAPPTTGAPPGDRRPAARPARRPRPRLSNALPRTR